MATRILLLLLPLVGQALPDSIPSFVRPCARDVPDFNACALQKAKEGIPFMAKGDRKMGVPPLDPMQITEINVVNGGGLNLVLRNATLYGLTSTEPTKIDFNFKKKFFTLEFNIPKLKILSKYRISGRLLLLPITGNGDLNCTMVDATLVYKHSYDTKTINGKEHMVIKDLKANYTPKRMYLSLTNLFNGENLLGREMNEFLDKNWKDVYTEVDPAIDTTFTDILTSILTNVNNAVPYDSLFPDKL